jgi:lipopolysaccharide export system permease protein
MVIWLAQSLRFIDLIVNRGLPVSTFLYLASLLMPSLLGIVMPIALFVAAVYTYNKMIMESELVVLESTGLSKTQLALPSIELGIVACLFSYIISLYLLPVSYREFKDMQNFVRNNYATILLQEEIFNSPVDGLTVFIKERGKDGSLRGILVHDNRDASRPITMIAQEGKLVNSGSGPQFLLINGNRQEIDEKGSALSILNFASYTLDIGMFARESFTREREPEEKFVGELFQTTARLDDDKAASMRNEAHRRITWPLYSLIMPLIGSAFLLSGEFNRRGLWRRILLSVAVASLAVGGGFLLNNLLSNVPALYFILYIYMLACILLPLYFIRGKSSGRLGGGHHFAVRKSFGVRGGA